MVLDSKIVGNSPDFAYTPVNPNQGGIGCNYFDVATLRVYDLGLQGIWERTPQNYA
jgi:hypothetical protein